MPNNSVKLARLQARLADIHMEQQRQIGYAGVRLGVFARLRELQRDERRVMRQIERLTIPAEEQNAAGA